MSAAAGRYFCGTPNPLLPISLHDASELFWERNGIVPSMRAFHLERTLRRLLDRFEAALLAPFQGGTKHDLVLHSHYDLVSRRINSR